MSGFIADLINPTETEIQQAKESTDQLALLLPDLQDKLSLKIESKQGDIRELQIPGSAIRFLFSLLSEMSQGNAVTLVPYHAELTTQQAADYLNVSRPHLVKVLERGDIPYRKVGTHRKVMFQDVINYQQMNKQKRESALDELVAQSQELDMGY